MRYQCNEDFRSTHGHKFSKGVIIGAVRYALLHHGDRKYFTKLTGSVALQVHHTTHAVIYDDSPFYEPIAGFPMMAAPETIVAEELPAWNAPQDHLQPDFGGFAGGDTGGGGAGGDFSGNSGGGDSYSSDSGGGDSGGSSDSGGGDSGGGGGDS